MKLSSWAPPHFGQTKAGYVRPIVLEYVGRTRRSMPNVRRNGRESGPAPSASLRDTTRQSQPSRPSGSRKIAWPPIIGVRPAAGRVECIASYVAWTGGRFMADGKSGNGLVKGVTVCGVVIPMILIAPIVLLITLSTRASWDIHRT